MSDSGSDDMGSNPVGVTKITTLRKGADKFLLPVGGLHLGSRDQATNSYLQSRQAIRRGL